MKGGVSAEVPTTLAVDEMEASRRARIALLLSRKAGALGAAVCTGPGGDA